jgi:LysM repeat protein
MNSIRPLITITILVVVGAYLYMKINEGPVQPAGAEEWENGSLEDVPPLEPVAAAATGQGSAAPSWGGAGATGNVGTGVDNSMPGTGAPASADVSTNSGTAPGVLPAVPAIPELPVSATEGQFGPPAAQSVPIPNDLPQNIPVAQYPDGPAGSATTTYQGVNSSAPQYQAAAGQASQQAGLAATVPPAANSDVANTTPTGGLATGPADSQDASQQSPANPLRQSAPATSQADPYGNSIYGQAPPPASTTAPATASFAASLPAIEMALERRELARALELLTPWHNDPSLTATEAGQVEALLSQLAGTVVYSTEHQLEPARVVKAGETLETIAKEYNVPWQLLAKINGIPAADQVRPGQALKVLRGPFSAAVDLNRKELTLMVGDHYAGKFPIEGTSTAPVSEGEWIVRSVSHGGPRGMLLTRADALPGTPTQEPTFLGPVKAFERVGLSTGVGLTEADANEVADILSVGSRVVIRR